MAKHREYDREATVYVWRYESSKRPGHAALKLTGLPGADRIYISWWPSGGVGNNNFRHLTGDPHESYKEDMECEMSERTQTRLRGGLFTLRPNQREISRSQQGVVTYGTMADEVIKLPLQGAQGCIAGLSGEKILAWWEIFKNCPHPTYKFASKNKNCSGVVAAALRVGGADQFARSPQALLFIDPNQIAAWAKKLKKKLKKRNEAGRRLALELDVNGVPQTTAPVEELMAPRTWLELSNRNMKPGQPRSPLLQEIDRALLRYFSHRGWTEISYACKLIALGRLMDAIHTYLGVKSGGKRGDAVLTLGRQVLDVARKRYSEAEEDDRMIVDAQSLWCKQNVHEEDPDD
ncbi:MAG TPA: hypothetical protein PKD86_01775 [Gemmatales bacterium]|mgnify:CR=1 FL=1|nr:hypothetical protein [Gemmatales bacterium]HMP58056.1 hypothetical protein [Gemmatales bacterium]